MTSLLQQSFSPVLRDHYRILIIDNGAVIGRRYPSESGRKLDMAFWLAARENTPVLVAAPSPDDVTCAVVPGSGANFRFLSFSSNLARLKM